MARKVRYDKKVILDGHPIRVRNAKKAIALEIEGFVYLFSHMSAARLSDMLKTAELAARLSEDNGSDGDGR